MLVSIWLLQEQCLRLSSIKLCNWLGINKSNLINMLSSYFRASSTATTFKPTKTLNPIKQIRQDHSIIDHNNRKTLYPKMKSSNTSCANLMVAWIKEQFRSWVVWRYLTSHFSERIRSLGRSQWQSKTDLLPRHHNPSHTTTIPCNKNSILC